MQEAIIHYFELEQAGMIYLFVIGFISALLSWFCFRRKRSYRPVAYLLALLASVQLVVSLTVYIRSDYKKAALLSDWHDNSSAMLIHELARISAVVDRFDYFKVMELVFVSVSLWLIYKLRGKRVWQYFFIALMFQALAMFFVEYQAEQRALFYQQALERQAAENFGALL